MLARLFARMIIRTATAKGLAFCPAVSQGVVHRHCGSNGLWERDDSGDVWRDKSQCEEEEEITSQEVQQMSLAQGFICSSHKWHYSHSYYISPICSPSKYNHRKILFSF